jgi:hypothetical protein
LHGACTCPGLRLRLGDRLALSPINILFIICREILPRFSNKSSASAAVKSGGSDAALKSESRRPRKVGDNRAADSRSRPPFAVARDLISGSDGVGATEASLKSLSLLLAPEWGIYAPCLLA